VPGVADGDDATIVIGNIRQPSSLTGSGIDRMAVCPETTRFPLA
jgi:hypothetical protein